MAVLPITKIQFWKQITTPLWYYPIYRALYYQSQRYNFESKSQPYAEAFFHIAGCITNHKDTILKANHNALGKTATASGAVLPITKIQFWKQITTAFWYALNSRWLYYQSQRYNFESKSQLYKREPRRQKAVLPITKIQFWKQITTTWSLRAGTSTLYYQSQRYNFESKSQQCFSSLHFCYAVLPITKIQFWKQITTRDRVAICCRCCITNHKDTILKANHNTPRDFMAYTELYYQSQRYNFESKSQQVKERFIMPCAVLPITKIQFWKQITTTYVRLIADEGLYYQSQRYNFESKSQLRGGGRGSRGAVLPITKIQFWKQITTAVIQSVLIPELYYQSQRYNFESKSQQHTDTINF